MEGEQGLETGEILITIFNLKVTIRQQLVTGIVKDPYSVLPKAKS